MAEGSRTVTVGARHPLLEPLCVLLHRPNPNRPLLSINQAIASQPRRQLPRDRGNTAIAHVPPFRSGLAQCVVPRVIGVIQERAISNQLRLVYWWHALCRLLCKFDASTMAPR